ncbi:hypothetical protein BS78_05G009800 [Paspalum vaginatum]|nr:hypothetical protein BS78_05G009800 [Paspalum vaginatum]
MVRRFVNVVVESRKTRIHSLHRLDVAKHLLYVPVDGRGKKSCGGGLWCWWCSTSINGRYRDAAREDHELQFLPSRPSNPFSLEFFGLVSPRTSEGRILCTSSSAFVFDADARACQHMPSLGGRKGHGAISFSVPRAGAGAQQDEDDLYVMSACHEYNYYYYRDKDPDDAATPFEVLELGSRGERRWAPLPPPRYYSMLPPGDRCPRARRRRQDHLRVVVGHMHVGTYCFRHRRAPVAQGRRLGPSALRGRGPACRSCWAIEWRDHLAVPQEWRCEGPPSLVNLGAGRFCVAKLFEVLRSPPDDDDDGGLCYWGDFDGYGWPDEQRVSHRVVLFTGVELDDNDTASAGMMPRIVPHKSRLVTEMSVNHSPG